MPYEPLSPRYRHFRIRVFAATWLCYAGLYFCRHAFFVAKGDLTRERGLDAATLGWLGVAYLVAYAVGEFNAAALGTRIGPRRMLLTGMAVSIAANVGFGMAHSTPAFMVLMAFNGLAQATGWSGNIGTMAQWFRRRERGQVMGLWSTCYQLGAVAAKAFADEMLRRGGLRGGFWGAAAVLGAVWVTFFVLQRNRPEDVGLEPLRDDDEEPGRKANSTEQGVPPGLVATIALMGLFYFFIKTIRYALWSWAPYLLQLNFGLAHRKGLFSAIFDICGFFGVLSAGVVSDRLLGGRRATLSLWMVAGLAAATVFLWLRGGSSLAMFGVSLGAIGFMLYGPDSLITGAGAIDVGQRRYALAAAGTINGMGSIGPVLQEVVIGRMYTNNPTDLTPIFALLTGLATAATVVMWLLARRARQGRCNL